MSVDETINESIDQSPTLYVIAAMVVALMLTCASVVANREEPPAPIRGVSDGCDSPSCVSPRQLIGASEALLMKRRLGTHALLVDVGSLQETPPLIAIASDLHAPFMEPTHGLGVEFRLDFAEKVDEALRNAHMGPDEPIILMSPSVERSVLAALLLQERGYTGVLVMRDRARERRGAAADPFETHGTVRIPVA